jgi:exodeoxyribonuclease VII large subunit
MPVSTIPQGVKILSVAELTRAVKGLLEDAFPTLWVTGQITNYKAATSGHIYLTLKDSEAQVRACIWRSTALRLRFSPHDGLEVIARGKLDVYVPHGEYKLIIEELHPKGLGAPELALRQLKEKLFKLGYFAPERKKPLPRFPRRIALVTSPTGAAVRDILEVLARRWRASDVWVCPVRVQGETAAAEITAALRLLNHVANVDVVIVGRGGGSAEDLSAFNDENVAKAIFESHIPIVSAVGHEIDLTIADLVADCRAVTPSEAAERIVPHRDELAEHLRKRQQQLRIFLLQRLELSRQQVQALAERWPLRFPLERIREREQRLDNWTERIQRAARQHVERWRERLGAHAARLETLSPLNVLARGYSLTRREIDHAVVRDPEQVQIGDRLVTHVQHGRIVSRVEANHAETNVKDDPFPA